MKDDKQIELQLNNSQHTTFTQGPHNTQESQKSNNNKDSEYATFVERLHNTQESQKSNNNQDSEYAKFTQRPHNTQESQKSNSNQDSEYATFTTNRLKGLFVELGNSAIHRLVSSSFSVARGRRSSFQFWLFEFVKNMKAHEASKGKKKKEIAAGFDFFTHDINHP